MCLKCIIHSWMQGFVLELWATITCSFMTIIIILTSLSYDLMIAQSTSFHTLSCHFHCWIFWVHFLHFLACAFMFNSPCQTFTLFYTHFAFLVPVVDAKASQVSLGCGFRSIQSPLLQGSWTPHKENYLPNTSGCQFLSQAQCKSNSALKSYAEGHYVLTSLRHI